ncbi:MAG: EAL domain-containing protein [Pseudomonadota bacterium]
MARADLKRVRKNAAANVGLGFTQSLQFKLGILFLLALLLLAAGAFLASRTLVQEKLLDESFRYEQETGLRLAADLRTLVGDAQALAAALANLAAAPDLQLEQLSGVGPTLMRNRPSGQIVSSLGIWPEPNQIAGATERSSLYWVRDNEGVLIARNDYNDTRSAPYYRERWYTPGRYLGIGRGYWTDRRKEPVLNRDVLTYVVPIQLASGFAGVATVSLDAALLNQRFSQLATDSGGYALLLDGEQRLLGASAKVAATLGARLTPGMTIAELAKTEPAYAPLALAAFKRREEIHAAMTRSNRYDARQVSALKDGTRALSRQEADDILSSIWSAELVASAESKVERTAMPQDAVLREEAWATVFDLKNPAWTLVRVTAANEGFAGASYLFRQSLVVTLGLVTLTLILAFFALRALVIRPLKTMIDQLASSHSTEDALNVVLDASARNEVGLVAHWQNERIGQLREAMDQARAAKSQLSSESNERKHAQQQLARAQERAALALQSVSDAVMTTDERGHVEDMNLAAEALTGMTLRESRGRPLTEIARFRLEGSEEHQNLALLAMERGARLDYSSGIMLDPHKGEARQLVLNGSPMLSRGRMVGTVLVFHELTARSEREPSETVAAMSRHQQDLLTGLATRARCEQRLTVLIEQAKGSGLSHGLVFLDVDHLKRINEAGGQSAGDDVLVRVAETLSQAAPSARDVYRIAADQFAVIIESVDLAAAAAAAEQLRERLAATRFYWESRYFSVTASFGVVLLDRELPSSMEAIRRADDACAAAKRAGRNAVQVYDPRMDRVGRIVDDDTWVRCIKRGLADNLFHLRTQWIMPGKDYAAEGQCYEVLLALEDEEGFWASPAAFMPVAERHHLTTTIDRWVIDRTLRYLEDHPTVVETMAFCSINLSPATLADPTFLDFIAGCIERHPEFASKLCFEVGEPALTDYPREAALCCDVLHRIGCRLSIDHYFGRHLSDLTMLRKLPVDFIKLDAQGFKNLGGDAVEQMMAESILRIVRHLRRRVIVNNIDDAGSMEIWKKLGADYFQGYAFAKPTPVAFLPPG